ncbi:MAG: hypothetical protein COZ92_01955 [Candidatus Nealsonbacteria bacterium CG_4_8_14_3_um_filter_40_11]|uniref:Methyltransferase type 11 domain-containing protein n=2 Tax=Candidatus Nealsoniibacteriota TaxID=1817911 RepID=A0A2M7UVN6_9BACT|nr:MAG: hypothetical protein COZ92_01955 [Candidatus Nealsonbacteria bacterium CG_4_8_14_3_um_filter_40_11]PIZ88022.1 MAG: hypothetical protein COX91_02390 [Candidatus Nealsonbacteria bacterium CG_4_10_14_0_2_um_filter_39_15]
MNYYQIFSRLYQRAAKKMCQDCQSFIKNGSRILDLGCGCGIVGKTFQDFFEAEVLGVDVKDYRVSFLPFQIYDGLHLPFSEKSFDTVLINYVLHHSEDPIALLKEAKRVARDKIVVYEDLPNGVLSSLICQLHGASFAKFLGDANKISFKSEKEWEKLFGEIGLSIIFKKKISNFPVKKELFILEHISYKFK